MSRALPLHIALIVVAGLWSHAAVLRSCSAVSLRSQETAALQEDRPTHEEVSLTPGTGDVSDAPLSSEGVDATCSCWISRACCGKTALADVVETSEANADAPAEESQEVETTGTAEAATQVDTTGTSQASTQTEPQKSHLDLWHWQELVGLRKKTLDLEYEVSRKKEKHAEASKTVTEQRTQLLEGVDERRALVNLNLNLKEQIVNLKASLAKRLPRWTLVPATATQKKDLPSWPERENQDASWPPAGVESTQHLVVADGVSGYDDKDRRGVKRGRGGFFAKALVRNFGVGVDRYGAEPPFCGAGRHARKLRIQSHNLLS